MQIIHEITTHLDRKEPAPVLDMVQGESARAVALSLYEKDLPWQIPGDAHVAVRYGNLDRGNLYDTLDGQSACTVSGNTVTVVLSPGILAQAGITSVQLVLTQGEGVLATFAFHVRVEPDPSAGKPGCDAGEIEPSPCRQAVADSLAAAERAEDAADRAEDAADRAEDAADRAQNGSCSGCVKSVNGIYPDYWGNVDISTGGSGGGGSGSGDLQTLRVHRDPWGHGGSCDEYSPYVGLDLYLEEFVSVRSSLVEPYDLARLHEHGPRCILKGWFKAGDTEFRFANAYALVNWGSTEMIIFDITSGTVYAICYDENGGCTIKATAIGEGTGGSENGAPWRLVKSVTLESDVSQIAISTDEAGNPLALDDAFIVWNNGQHDKTAPTNTQMNIVGIAAQTGMFNLAFAFGTSNHKGWIALDRFDDQLRLTYAGGKPSLNNDYVRGSGTVFGNIEKITKIQLQSADDTFVAGATLKLYTRG